MVTLTILTFCAFSVTLLQPPSWDGRDIVVSPVLEFGKDLPSGKNLADYVDNDCMWSD